MASIDVLAIETQTSSKSVTIFLSRAIFDTWYKILLEALVDEKLDDFRYAPVSSCIFDDLGFYKRKSSFD
ncbi:hypothetical protein AGR4B_Lc10258 [Agrobacterium tumefaciens str. CFBP 5621]|nr:hypothetical protein AGR4B_Lc10258 [Agrobacterium tumefaciens str. CFBP 5621]